jgi:hypothetical protein
MRMNLKYKIIFSGNIWDIISVPLTLLDVSTMNIVSVMGFTDLSKLAIKGIVS